MSALDAVSAALRSLRANFMRSVLTALGIIIGVGAVIIMVSIGSGARQSVDKLIESVGANLIIVSPGSSRTRGVRGGAGSRQTISWDDAIAIESEVAGVYLAAPSARGSGQIILGNRNWATSIEGVVPSYITARNWQIETGRGFTEEDVISASKAIIIGQTIVDELFDGQDPIGETVRLQRVPFEVVGTLVGKGQSSFGNDQDDVVFIPLSTAKQRVLGGRYLGGRTVGQISIQARSAEMVGVVEDRVTELLRQRHGLRETQDNDFRIRNISELLSAREESSRVMAWLLAAVASVSLVVGGIGIMNIMLVSVTERTREIGLRMAVGARGRDVLAQFLIEATALSLVGGLMGIALGVGGSILIADLAQWPLQLNLRSVVMAAAFAALVGVFFGFYPARKASRLDPIEALRYE